MRAGLSKQLLTIGATFSTAVALFFTGLSTAMHQFYYASGGVSVIAVCISIYFLYKSRKKAPQFEGPPQLIRVYTDPTMKRNKSDSNLELIENRV
jgi:hypothetical protein